MWPLFLPCFCMAKIRNVPFPRPCGATGNDAQKLHASAFAHFRGAVLRHEVFLPIFSWIHRKSNRWFHYESAAFFVLQKIFEFFSLRESINEPSRCLPIEGQNEFPHEPWKSNTHSTGTFLIGGESPSRMKVRHELPAHKGYRGKQGAIPNHSEISVCCG